MQPETTRPALLVTAFALTVASGVLALAPVSGAPRGDPVALAGAGLASGVVALGLYLLDRGRLRRVGMALALMTTVAAVVSLVAALVG